MTIAANLPALAAIAKDRDLLNTAEYGKATSRAPSNHPQELLPDWAMLRIRSVKIGNRLMARC